MSWSESGWMLDLELEQHYMKHGFLDGKGVKSVDTTCPLISKIQDNVEKCKKESFASVIHERKGMKKYLPLHSFVGNYIIVKGIKEATQMCVTTFWLSVATKLE